MSNEFQQVAALTSLDIDTLAKVAESEQWNEKDLREMIFRLKKQKDLLISDANVRETRYNATCKLLSTARKDS